jgi:uncharacterized protein (DUF1697 family)
MTRCVVLLRAVNVGGRNKLPMADLRQIATDLGYTDVATYVQSGNLVLTATPGKPAEIEQAISSAVHRALGLTIDVIVRTRTQLAAVVDANPFPDHTDDPTKLHVSFLTGQPPAAARKACDPDEFDPERFEFGDRCVYLWHPDGVGRSKMATAPWAKRLGVKGTGRNWRTVITLLEMLDASA